MALLTYKPTRLFTHPCDGPVDKRMDVPELFLGLSLCRQVDLVLQDQAVLQLRNLDGGQLLRRLGLWARLVGS